MTSTLKIDNATALATIARLTASTLLAGADGPITLTDPGRARYDEIRGALDAVTARLYGDLPADDLATAGRVLATVTTRANAELDGAQAPSA